MALHSDVIHFPSANSTTKEEDAKLHDHQLKLQEDFLLLIAERALDEILVVRHNQYPADDWRHNKNHKYDIVDVLGICRAGGTSQYQATTGLIYGRPMPYLRAENAIKAEAIKTILGAFPQTISEGTPDMAELTIEKAKKLGFNLKPKNSWDRYELIVS